MAPSPCGGAIPSLRQFFDTGRLCMLKHRSSRRLALAGVAVVALAQGVAGAATQNPIGLTQPVQITKGDEDPLRTYSGPFMAVDPGNSDNVVASFADFRSR